jgi:vanillate O-demethylase ferredoxin subunit
LARRERHILDLKTTMTATRNTSTTAPEQTLQARIHSITYAAQDILLFDLRQPDGAAMPAFAPGAHIDIHMPKGMSRSYSLLNDCAERHRYVVGVQKDRASRGGSIWLHESARVGQMLTLVGPRNNFALVEDAPHVVFIGGGIGITPLWCMIQRLNALGRAWTLHYGARTRDAAALLGELTDSRWRERVTLNFDDASGGKFIDIPAIVAAAPAGAHFYCCGPVPMLQAFEAACQPVDPARVHLEYFGAKEAPATGGGYTVRLARSGQQVAVREGQTILDALQAAGFDVPSSCQQGVCGVCETTVMEGTPDHRDLVLSDQEKAANRTMMICCSGSLTPNLVLDL